MPALGSMLNRGGPPPAPPMGGAPPMAGGGPPPPPVMPGGAPAGPPPGGGDQIAVLKQLLSNPQVRQMVKALIAQAEAAETGVVAPGGLPAGPPGGAAPPMPQGAPSGYQDRMPA